MKLLLTAAILSVAIASCADSVNAEMTVTKKCVCTTTRTYKPCGRKARKVRAVKKAPVKKAPVKKAPTVINLPPNVETNIILRQNNAVKIDNVIQGNKQSTPANNPTPAANNVPQRTSSSTSVTINGSFNTVTNNVTPELMVSQKLGSDVQVNGYVGFGNTGYSIIPGTPATTKVISELTSITPGRQYIAAVHYDRSVFSWKDNNGLRQQTVKDCVYTANQIAEKKAWIENSGGTYYGTFVLPSGAIQYATEDQRNYTSRTVADKPAVEARREALSGITGGVEIGVNVLSPNLSATVGAKMLGSEVAPTVGLNLVSATEGGFVNVGVRKTLLEGAGTDVRAGGGINF